MTAEITTTRSSGRVARSCAAGLLALSLLGGCASSQNGDAGFGDDNDPLEFVNRFTFAINDALDTVILQPVAATYRFLLPDPVQDSIRNASRNLGAPVVLFNDLFQGEWERAETTAMRFLINSTLGVVGLFDVAAEWGYEYHTEDFGQTLAVWGVGEGFYLVLPILGPSSARDTAGIVVDSFLDPWPYVLDYATDLTDDEITYIFLGRRAITGIDLRARNIEVIDSLKADSIDYYSRLRSLYRQNRESEIRNGRPAEIPLPDFGDEISE
ncbi:MAG: VacJ family lipoprotein [Pseudomonadota bacterium]